MYVYICTTVHFFAFLITSCVFAFSIFSFILFLRSFGWLCVWCACARLYVCVLLYCRKHVCMVVSVVYNVSLLYAQREVHTSFPFDRCTGQDRLFLCCSSFEFCRSHAFRSQRNIRLQFNRIYKVNIPRFKRNYSRFVYSTIFQNIFL